MSAVAIRPTRRLSRFVLVVVVLVMTIGLPASGSGGPTRGEPLRNSSTAHPHQLRGDLHHYHGVRHNDHPISHRPHPVRDRNAAIV